MARTVSQSRQFWKQMDSSVKDKDPNAESQLEPFQEPSPRKSGQRASKGQAKAAASSQLQTKAILPAKATPVLPMRGGSWREQATPVQRRVQENLKEAETSSSQTTWQYQTASPEQRRRAVTEELEKLQIASQGQLQVTPEAWSRSTSRSVTREYSDAARTLIEERKKRVDQAVAKLLEAQRQEALVQATAHATVLEAQSRAQLVEVSAQKAGLQLPLSPSSAVREASNGDEAVQERHRAVSDVLAQLLLPSLSEEPETEKDESNKRLDQVTNVVLQLIEAQRKDAVAEAAAQQLALAGAKREPSPVKTLRQQTAWSDGNKLAAAVCVGTGLAGSCGGVLGAVCGASSGAMCGLLVAPFTFGLSVPICATVGSAAGVGIGSASGGMMGATAGLAVGMAMRSGQPGLPQQKDKAEELVFD
eukprot:TRINITY_DN2424_c0_g1_i2.p1 TRINITY_DN2424_c0_g1~~TRINITY_DN2424_c0_g1_i2.p1  ORF type:complete len:419 (-),score=100.80 TRINITY_DN2424_c0_g1_i2:58-1314(-)